MMNKTIILTFIAIIFIIVIVIMLLTTKTEKQTTLNTIQAVLSTTDALCGTTDEQKLANSNKTFVTPITCVNNKNTNEIVDDSFCTTLATAGKIDARPTVTSHTCPDIILYDWKVNNYLINTIADKLIQYNIVSKANTSPYYIFPITTQDNTLIKAIGSSMAPNLILFNAKAFPFVANASYILIVNNVLRYTLKYAGPYSSQTNVPCAAFISTPELNILDNTTYLMTLILQ